MRTCLTVYLALVLVFTAQAVAEAQSLKTFGDLRRDLGSASGSGRRTFVPAIGPQCELPEAPNESRIVQLSAYQGQGISTVTIGSQDIEVTTATVTVEPGKQPLYVVISSYKPVIWRFRGAVERIQRLILASATALPGSPSDAMPLAGATNLPSAKVFFVRRRGCLRYFSEVPSVAAASAAGFVHREAGRAPDMLLGHYAVSEFAIPSGQINEASRPVPTISHILGMESGGDALDREVRNYSPDGVVQIEAGQVVASDHVEPYQVLPNQAGLQQLMRAGALTANRGGEFLIRRKIRYPAELTGGHAVTFLLLKGVPPPDGQPGHSCVVSEETGLPISNSITCR